MTTRRPLSSPSSSPPSKRQRLSSPIYDQQAGNITSEDLEAFDRFEASQSSNADFRNDPENPFAAGAAGFTSASKLHTTRPASPGDRRSSSPPPPEPDYDAWFAPATGVPTMVTFQTARTAATAAPSATFGKASGVGVFQPSSAALAKAKEKMSVWTETTTTTSQSGVENLFKSAASLPRVASPERPIRTLGNATNSPSTPSPAEGFRSASMALSTQSTPSIALSNNKRFKAPTFVNSPLNPNARRPESTLNHMLSTPLRTPYRSAQPLPSSSAVRTKPAFKTPFKAGMKPGQVGHAALLTKQTPVQTTPLKTPTSALPAPTRTVKQFFDLKPPPERKTLRSSGRTPQEYTAADLTQYGVNVAELERITPSIAAYYSFHTTTPELLTELPFTPSKAFGTAAALEELLARGCSLATKRWVDNHWCLILWKLAGMVCLEPELEKDPRTKRWCWEEVMRQLFYRYERELNCGVRPPLRNIATQDAPASCPIVLCVSNITWLDGGMSDDGVALPAHPELEVTDGWYRLRAQVDAPLARAIRRGVIRIGRKVGVVGAQLSNERKEPQEVLEAYNSTKLQFVGNCTHLVPWHTKLGFQTSPWIATMRSLTADGGLVPALDVVLLKVYPVAYIEFIEEDGQKRREGPRSAKEEAQEEEHWKRRREVHESKLREAMDKKEMRYRGYAERLERKAGRSITSGEDEPPDEIDDLYDQLEEADEAAQVLSHISAVNAGWLARCIMNRLEKERERGADEIEQELKTSCPPREVRNFRVIFVQDAVTVRRTSSRTAQLTIWDALKYPAMNMSYVYAVHAFVPEHEDEVPFEVGERIEVVERDDEFGDGWWRGRNLAGKVGLFPQSYTTTVPPPDAPNPTVPPPEADTSVPALQALPEELESPEISPLSPPPDILLNDNGVDGNGEMMKATMTDVQKAIEQLGSRNRSNSVNFDHDARSFSFASTRDERTSDDEETDFDISEGEGWHKGARRKLAEKARQAVAEAEKLEALSTGLSSRTSAPPIEVDISDESENEGDDDDHDIYNSPLREHPYIPEEEEPAEDVDQLGRMRSQEDIPATATAHSFPSTEVPPTPVSLGMPPTVVPIVEPVAVIPLPPSPTPIPPPLETSRDKTVSPGLPSPALSGGQAGVTSKHSSVASSAALAAGVVSKPSSVASAPLSALSEGKQREDSGHAASVGSAPKHPSEWSVEEVVEWLRSKGFDDDVCDKFTEQEITGDVLLDLDVNLLKTEIGIMAFGKRMRIANTIADLRRPPSPSASFSQGYNPQNSPQHAQYAVAYPHPHTAQPYPNSPQYTGHSRTQSQSHSHNSYNGHTSLQSSVGSPLANGYLAQTYGLPNGLLSPESATNGEFLISPVEEQPKTDIVDLGASSNDSMGAKVKGRPAQLTLSPSDGALKATATQSDVVEEDERAVMSESELPASASIRKRIFGARAPSSPHSVNDQGSVNSKENESSVEGKSSSKKKESNIAPGPGRHARGRKSIDASTQGKGAGERLSIFGASFGGTLGRKPAPRYSSGADDDKVDKTSSGFTLPRLNRKNGRPSTPGGAAVPAEGISAPLSPPVGPPPPATPATNPALLRKRTSSGQTTNEVAKAANAAAKASNGTAKAPPASNGNVPSAVSKLKPNMSIIEQIGESDHAGWMRKKGDRYSGWKLRYFVLKGPDLYCLKSSNKSETKIKAYINVVGYKVTVDENVHPGRYGFRIDHDHDKTHFFSSDEKTVVRDWMKAIMKATIGRDYSKPVVSSCNIPTIPLMVAQAMNPAPRPPSPTARAATQRAMRRENTDQPSTRDARVLMLTGFATSDNTPKEERTRLDSFFTNETVDGAANGGAPGSPQSFVPPRPTRRMSTQQAPAPVDEGLVEWANSHLPSHLQIVDPAGPLCDGLGLLRLAESIKGKPSSPPVPDSAFPKDPTDDNLDGLFRLFDLLLDNEVRMGSVSINDIRQGKRDKVIQLLRGLKGWEDKRMQIATSIGKGSAQAGGFMASAY
ncbi:hypothetical protein MIND_00509500 [Mycena indigotica]|uniref:Uncharacterized protein n=1 Tax=Mycena indigotica TaxID=2126181 RepID=A0A8H6SXG6_9AGAR|nr:uncharacterized protein MIND_00509500 [Mycena indigotica]KAF7307159.1 hypothetical protein MIND_00509500 [Mycena indigotica]